MINTHKRIIYALCYGARSNVLAKRYGWRRVKEAKRIILKRTGVSKHDQH